MKYVLIAIPTVLIILIIVARVWMGAKYKWLDDEDDL